MSLAPGTRLGPYEIVAPLGAGNQRFLVVEPVADAGPAAIEVDLNWTAALEKR